MAARCLHNLSCREILETLWIMQGSKPLPSALCFPKCARGKEAANAVLGNPSDLKVCNVKFSVSLWSVMGYVPRFISGFFFLIDMLDACKWQTYIHCPSVNRAVTNSLSGYWAGIYTTADTGNFLHNILCSISMYSVRMCHIKSRVSFPAFASSPAAWLWWIVTLATDTDAFKSTWDLSKSHCGWAVSLPLTFFLRGGISSF